MQSGPGNTNRLYLAVPLISFSVLMFEIGVTRIFSILYNYHYSFLAITLAFSGLGLGAFLFESRIRGRSFEFDFIALTGSFFGLILTIIVFLTTTWSGLADFYIIISVSVLPFFLSGIFLSYSFEKMAHKSGSLYSVDLLGATAGVIVFLAIINFGGVAALLLSAISAALLSIIMTFGSQGSKKIRSLAIIFGIIPVVTLSLYISLGFPGNISLLPNYHKEMYHIMNHPNSSAEVVKTKWSSFGRTDLIKDKNNANEMVFFIDGSAGSSMYKFNGNYNDSTYNQYLLNLKNFSGYTAAKLVPDNEKENALIIGPGGGRDIHTLKLAGTKDITAVEINGDLIELANNYSEYNGNIFDSTNGITVIEDEGRSFLRNTTKMFDLIYMSIPIIKSSRSPDGFSLSENYLYTVESFLDYFDHLKDNGRIIIIAHGPGEIYKLLFTILDALAERGIKYADGMTHLYIAGFIDNPYIVVKNNQIDSTEARVIHDQLMIAQDNLPMGTYIPFISQHRKNYAPNLETLLDLPMLNQNLVELESELYTPQDLIKVLDINVNPPHDDSPFFYNFEKSIPGVLIVTLISTLILVCIFLIKGSIDKGKSLMWNRILYQIIFVSIGAGFMLIEIPLIQKYILFLGKPVYSMSVLFISCLSGAGLGSYLSSRIKISSSAKINISIIAVIFLTVFQIYVVPYIFNSYLSTTINFRIALSMLFIFPLGFFLGIPFPTAIKMANSDQHEMKVSYLWGINSLGTLFGSILATVIAIIMGYSNALYAGILFYILAFIAGNILKFRHVSSKI